MPPQAWGELTAVPGKTAWRNAELNTWSGKTALCGGVDWEQETEHHLQLPSTGYAGFMAQLNTQVLCPHEPCYSHTFSLFGAWPNLYRQSTELIQPALWGEKIILLIFFFTSWTCFVLFRDIVNALHKNSWRVWLPHYVWFIYMASRSQQIPARLISLEVE